MAETHQFSTLRTAEKDPTVTVTSDMQSSRHEVRMADHTQVGAGDANSSVEICMTPPGRSQLIASLSSFRHTAFGAARVLSLGWRAYVDEHGAPQAANLTGLGSAFDVALAGRKTLADAPTGAVNAFVFETQRILVATVTGGTWPNAAVTHFDLTFTLG